MDSQSPVNLSKKYDLNTKGTTNVANVDNLGLIAGLFDMFDLENLINKRIGKEGSHVNVDCGCIVKCLTMQTLNAPYQTLSGTQEYFEGRPLDVLTRQKLKPEQLNRHAIGRMLDDVYEYGCEDLFLECSGQIAKKLNIKVTSAHLDSTSFHYDGESYKQEDCDVELNIGYSRDHRPELKQIISLMMCESNSKIPLYQKGISGNVNDNKSFNSTIKFAMNTIRQQFKDLQYLVGDSALFTRNNLIEAQKIKLDLVSRIPDGDLLAKECFESVLKDPTLLQPLDPDDKKCTTKYAWFDDIYAGEIKVKRLLINNESLKATKNKTVQNRASKEVKRAQTEVNKLQSKPCSCKADAVKELDKIIKKNQRCLFTNIRYEEVTKNPSRGKPKADTKKILMAVKAYADVSINEDAVARELKSELMMVLTTTDTKRAWKCEELLSLYKKQSTIERSWKMLKNPKFLINSIYLKKPSRITALLWLMSISLLVYCAGEYLLRKQMKIKDLSILSPDKSTKQKQPTMIRFLTYIGNTKITIVNKERPYMENIPEDMLLALDAFGDCISYYYIPQNYKNYFKKID